MPQFIRIYGYYAYFWSNEGIPTEPVHIHISKNVSENATKFWINKDRSLELAHNNSEIPKKDLKKIKEILQPLSQDIVELWEEHFKQPPTFIDKDEIEKDL